MKTLVTLLALVPALAFADLQLGTVDLMLLVRNHPDYDRNKSLLEATDKDNQKKLDDIKAEGDKMQEEGKKLAEQFRSPMLNDKAKGELEKKIAELQKKLMGLEQRYRSEAMRCRQELQDLEGRLLKATTADLRKRINKYAENGKYDMILDKNAAPYSKSSFDVTDDLLREMGVEPAKAKGRDEGK